MVQYILVTRSAVAPVPTIVRGGGAACFLSSASVSSLLFFPAESQNPYFHKKYYSRSHDHQ